MTRYLVEIRPSSYSKRYLRGIIKEVSTKFRIRPVDVPHITLFGPAKLKAGKREKDLVSAVVSAAKKYNGELVPFNFNGFGTFPKDEKVVFARVYAFGALKRLRQELAQELLKVAEPEKEHDLKKDFEFHATLSFKNQALNRKFDSVLKYLRRKHLLIPEHVLRVTILRNRKILREYDLLSGKLLTRNEALNRDIWRKTMKLLDERAPRRCIILDFEATRPPDSRGSSEDEITEIGAVKLNENYEVIDQFQSFVRPTRYPFIGEHRKRIGGFSQREIDGAESFPEVLKRFKVWVGAPEEWIFCSWGAYDRKLLQRECAFHRVEYPFTSEHINVKKEFARWMGCEPVGMADALKKANRPLTGTHHRGLDDAKNIATLFRLIHTGKAASLKRRGLFRRLFKRV